MTSQQKYYINHKEKCKQISKDWKAANPEKVKESNDKSCKKFVAKNYNTTKCAARTGVKGNPVMNVDTGEIYDTARQASIVIGRKSSTAVVRAIHMNQRCAGYYWRYLTQEEIDQFDGDL